MNKQKRIIPIIVFFLLGIISCKSTQQSSSETNSVETTYLGIEQRIQKIPGLYARGGSLTFRQGDVLVVLDGVLTNYQTLLSAVNGFDIKTVRLLKDLPSIKRYTNSKEVTGILEVRTKGN